MNEELRDCPFCGKQPKIERVRTDCYLTGEIEIFTEISCSNEECAFGLDNSSYENAIAAWNKRAPLTNWIKCDDLMPPVSETRLLICDIDKEILVAVWDGYRWQLDEGSIHRDYNVTHWMPLMQPPEEE